MTKSGEPSLYKDSSVLAEMHFFASCNTRGQMRLQELRLRMA